MLQVVGRTGEGVLAPSQTGHPGARGSPENTRVPNTAFPHGLCKSQDKEYPARQQNIAMGLQEPGHGEGERMWPNSILFT